MRTGLTKQEKTTDIWFDEKDPLIHIRTHNTDLKKRLAAYAGQHPDQCRQTDTDPDTGCMEFEIRKGRFSFRLTAPYSEERRNAASKAAKKHSGNLTHLNKAAGGQSAYRGLGSIDFRAAARSVLLIGRVKREPNVRVIVHDKSSLAPEGKPVAFCLDPETGFSWIGEYDITADELLSGAGGNTATKTEQAERLILELLADGKELASEDIVKAAAEAGISERTVQNAKRNMSAVLGAKRIGGQWYNFLKKPQPPQPAN